MTTLVWDGVTLAADKQVTEANRAASTMTKIGRLDANRLWAFSGEGSRAMQIVSWIRNGGPPPTPWPEGCEAWVVHRDGHVDVYESNPEPMVMDPGPLAAGSGGPVAHGAMLAGSDAYVAVALASMVDIYTGGGIDTLRFEPAADE